MPGQHFPSEAFPSVYELKKSLKEEAGILPRYIDCCLHGCRAFTGPYEPDTMCVCGESIYDSHVGIYVLPDLSFV